MKRNDHASDASRPVLESRRAEICRCVKCGSCRAVCPSFLDTKEESFSPRGRMALISAVLDGRLPVSAVFNDRLETCTTCLACQATCASNVPVPDIIQAAKEQAVLESGKGIARTILAEVIKHPTLFRAAAWLAPIALHYSPVSVKGGVRGTRSTFKVRQQKKKNSAGTVVFFPGCAVDHMQPEIGTATINVLGKLGFDVVVPEGLKCCGRPLLSLGDRQAAEELAVHNASVLKGTGADAIVTSCASCALTFKSEYPKLLRPGSNMPSSLDIHELLAARLGDSRLRPGKKTITWHDPCHLNRGQGLSKKIRDFLGIIPEITYVEMKNADRCCGFGGIMRMTHPRLSDGIAGEKVRNIIATQAAAVVTGCPGCRMQIIDGLRRAGSDIEVLHTVQVIEEVL